MRALVFLVVSSSCLPIFGQSFSSGSNGSGGALDLTAGDRLIALPDTGILNYTTVNIPAGRTLTFLRNLTNTPVTLLAQGNVTINGAINISASDSTPGPGGFPGGDPGLPGLGPGGGQPDQSAQWVGPLNLVPNIGGSGGGGHNGHGCFYPANPPIPGGGGGGAITLASSGAINVSGEIVARGANVRVSACFFSWTGQPGSDGAIRLIANSINVSGTLTAALVRLEAPLGQVIYNGCCSPVVAPINPLVVPTQPPTLTIVSIAGYPVPAYAGSSTSTIDLLLPTQLLDPIPILIQAKNIPAGSIVKLNANGGSPTATAPQAALVGSAALSTATLYVSNLNRDAVTFLFLSAIFDASLIATGPQRRDSTVAKIEVATGPGQPSEYRFLRKDGSVVPLKDVSANLRSILGI